ncbi:MAG: hypothetical protein M3Z04_04605 [Chloroflexota bacterium]|nr:hypothetical protein [Chloroflexota bacterium]
MTAPDSAVAPTAGEADLRLLYRSYGYLHDTPLIESSRTAAILHAPDATWLRARLADELDELAGVAAGTHFHAGLPDDAILEASQVCYWTFVTAVAARLPYEELCPHDCLLEATVSIPQQAAVLGQILAQGVRGGVGFVPPSDLRAALRQVGATCRALGISPTAGPAYDLAQMRTRSYMEPFFAAQGNGTA